MAGGTRGSIGAAADDAHAKLTPRGAAKRERILEVAAVLLARQGYGATTLADIARGSVDVTAARMLIVGAANWTAEWFDPLGTSTAGDVGRMLCRLVFEGIGAGRRERARPG